MTLTQFMKDREITDQALAQQLGVSRPHITKIRTGKRTPSLALAIELSRITKLPVTEFLADRAA
jgi:transcriptional regulator with XRE-family HTH domain